ncbi:hypothetical protein C1634_004265 [Chryseobacterium viscerum]|uniref:Uncharacterized protein n=1 Tax=Chryseobacterium viscerum TaxID=1037377 RepID=A0A316WTR8_9FLAO|nr:hypothetical protein C1634_004265 [Chryseobacterium viscerum]
MIGSIFKGFSYKLSAVGILMFRFLLFRNYRNNFYHPVALFFVCILRVHMAENNGKSDFILMV